MNNSTSGLGRTQRSEPSIPEIDDTRFEIGEAIGAGGMGTVHRAVQHSVGRQVAVKVLAPEHAANAVGLARFVREANAIARLTHPNIVQLIDFGRDRQGNMLLVMELLEGLSLRGMLQRESRLPMERAVFIMVQCLNALRTAHAAGVIHRDLKPENIFIQRPGEEDHVKVLDFGIAKLTENEPGNDHHTTQGTLIGTLRYMAPEQVAGEAPDFRIDVYAAGMVLYEMLSGRLPYDTRDRFVLLRQIIAEEPMHLALANPELPPALCDVVMRSVTKTPATRYQTADEFRRALLPFLGADAARLQSLSELSGRYQQPGVPNAMGEVRSGVIRSGAISAAEASQAMAMQPAASAEIPFQVAHSEVIRHAMQGAVTPSPVQPMPQPPSRAIPIVLGSALVMALLVVGGVMLLRGRQTPHDLGPMAVQTRAPSVAPSVAAPIDPPRPTSHMVTVITTPAGAQVTSVEGAMLCPATPCAIPVREGGSRSVRITAGDASLTAVLEPSASNARFDLTALSVAAPAVTADAGAATPSTAPRHGPRDSHPARPHRPEETNDIPMLLPGHGR